MLGYAFMGKAHSNAFKKIAYITWPPPLVPRLVGIAGRDEAAVGEAAKRYGYDYATTDWRELVADDRIGLFDNGGPNSLHAEPTIAAAEAGKHVSARSRSGATPTRATRSGSRVAATGVKHLCALQLPLRAGRAAGAGDDRGGRARRDPALPRPLPPGLGRRPDARHVALRSGRGGSGALGDLGTHVIDLARFLNGEIATVSGFVKTFLPGRRGRRRDRGRGRVRERLRRHDRGDAVRARPPQRVPVGDQRLEGLARVRHGAAERAAGVPRRRRPCTRLQDRARLGGEPSVLGVLVAAGAHHRLGRHLRARAAPLARGDRDRRRRRTRTARRSRTAIAPPRSATRSCAPGRAGSASARVPLPLGVQQQERRLAAAVARTRRRSGRGARAGRRTSRARPASARARDRASTTASQS